MQTLRLKRFVSDDQGTFGALFFTTSGTEHFFCFTAEPPWRLNATGRSCIPTGTYNAKPEYSPRFQKRLYELEKVPGRSEILIHTGNFAGDPMLGWRSDTEGCILVGREIGYMGIMAQRTVKHSAETYYALSARLKDDPIQIEVCK